MSYDLSLEIDTHLSEEAVIAVLKEVSGLVTSKSGNELDAAAMTIGVRPSDPDDTEVTKAEFDITSRIVIDFKLYPTLSESDPIHQVLSLVPGILARIDGDAVLETQDPTTLLLRKDEQVYLNPDFELASKLHTLFPLATERRFED